MGADDNAAPAVASSKPSKDVVYGKVKVSAKTDDSVRIPPFFKITQSLANNITLRNVTSSIFGTQWYATHTRLVFYIFVNMCQ